MLEKGKVSPRQTAELMFITILATAILFVPAILAEKAGHDAWLAVFTGVVIGLMTLTMLYWLGRKHPNQNLFEYSETILGKWPGKLVALAYTWTFLQLNAIIVREFGDFMSTSFMPNTPLSVFNFSLLVLAAFAVIAGLEVIARMNEFIIVLVLFFLFGILMLSVPNWDLNNLLPFMSGGMLKIISAAAVPSVFTGEVILLAVVMPYMTQPKKALTSGLFAVLGTTAVLTIIVVSSLAIFGPELVSSFRFPLHLFVRTIAIGKLLTRFESIVLITWVAGLFIKVAVFFYCTVIGVAQVSGMREYRSVVYPVGVITAVFSISFFENVAEIAEYIANVAPLNIIPFYIGMPAILIAVTVIREKFFGADFSVQKDKQQDHVSKE